MDRIDRTPVNGRRERRPALAGDHHARDKDPHGWRSHHGGLDRSPAGSLSAEELLEVVRLRAIELCLKRLRSGRPGTPEADWNRAMRDLRRHRNDLIERLHDGAGLDQPATRRPL